MVREEDVPGVSIQPESPGFPGERTEQTTGRYLVLLDPDNVKGANQALKKSVGLQLLDVGGNETVRDASQLQSGQALVFHDLGVAVVNAQPDQVISMNAAVSHSAALELMEEERYVYAMSDLTAAYLRGYRDAVNHLCDRILGPEDAAESAAAKIEDSGLQSWGLQAVKAGKSRYTGRGIRLAVLDTGIDLTHPDFVSRPPAASETFVKGVGVQDLHGHGTHCCGIACGTSRPQRLPRFGVAPGAELYVGKVLDNNGQGTDGGIIAGISWAMAQRCDIISMSLGGPVAPNQPYSRVYQQIARRALEANTLIIAAAGNDSRRQQGNIAPVSHPANCPSIMAVAALDRALAIAGFSNGGINADGKVDIAAPGVDILSTWIMPQLYRSISGTSMATPHVAGVAALLAESNPQARGAALWSLLTQFSQALPLSNRDVGSGLVQAP